ncbi:hypothetical protein LX36DRAFT_113222 [Colletotrichum falcatum]|nr:hypothetical protein LX36DRAFT_113222 [Colletotrichum falcatum]
MLRRYTTILERHLQNWYRRLPGHLQWKPATIKHAPVVYFLLKQRYNVSMILLHRPWAMYAENSGAGKSTGPYSTPDSSSGLVRSSNEHRNNHPETKSPYVDVGPSRMASPRRICNFHATCVAKVFWQHRQKSDGTKIFITAVQRAVTAAIALIAALAYRQSDFNRRNYLGHLAILTSAISDMGQVYEPVAAMAHISTWPFSMDQITSYTRRWETMPSPVKSVISLQRHLAVGQLIHWTKVPHPCRSRETSGTTS